MLIVIASKFKTSFYDQLDVIESRYWKEEGIEKRERERQREKKQTNKKKKQNQKYKIGQLGLFIYIILARSFQIIFQKKMFARAVLTLFILVLT